MTKKELIKAIKVLALAVEALNRTGNTRRAEVAANKLAELIDRL